MTATELGAPVPAAQRPVLVHMSPLPDSRNGIADYAAAILLRLAGHYQCICVVDDPQMVSQRIRRVAPVLSYDEYARVAADFAPERHLYHIGNNSDHVPILDALTRTPGVVVLHDLTLHYLMERWAQQSLGSPRHIRSIARLLHGAAGDELVDAKFNRKVPLQSIYGEVNCLPFLNGAARSLITHSQYGRVLATAAGFTGPIRVIPHFAEVPAADRKAGRRARFRREFGLNPEVIVLASLGFVVPAKLIHLTLRALAALPPGLPPWRYVIGGENRDPSVRQTCRDLGLEDRVIFLDYLEEEDFDTVLCAADVVVNLRFPTSGETSGTVCRALAHGLPCIVNDHGWYAELPDAVTYKVAPDDRGIAELTTALIRCLADPEERQAKARAAEAHALRHMALDEVAAAYRAAIEQAHAGPPVPLPPPSPPQITLPPPAGMPTQASGDPRRLLPRLLEGERIRAGGRALRAIVLPSTGPDLSGLAGGGDSDGAGPVQAFAALEVEEGIGGMVLLAADAWQALRPGDLLTLGLISQSPDLPAVPGRLTPFCPQLGPGEGLAERLEHILGQAGFETLRLTRIPVAPETPQDGFCRILLATARKLTDAEPTLACFRDCG